MNKTYLVVLAAYMLGFAAMYYYSLRRDAKCDLERNPREAILFAILWPALTFFMVGIIIIEKIISLVCAVCRYFRSKFRGEY
ncbi:hypothetical protein HV351_12445 [Citrobacter freundii]|uniref:hypothetical protein n=1 Tax=Citrobacter freundii TaxID=546 RepID=UPI0015E97011|nr:hypothetical protein [Citrobacter freundii]QLR19239.1 hypothetical protein HV351_12445 [Citrobacter freundii]